VTRFEERLWKWTTPVNGQYPRPWTSRATRPEAARVFLVGFNQATAFLTSQMTQEEVVNALMGRGATPHDDLYYGSASPSRRLEPDPGPANRQLVVDVGVP
jgi:hypothetical protein